MACLSKWNHVGVNHYHFILTTAKNRHLPPNTVSHKQKGITTMDNQEISQQFTEAFTTEGTSINYVALSGTVEQLTQFKTASGSTMSLGQIQGTGNRGRVQIEFTSFSDEVVLKQAYDMGYTVLLTGDLKLYKGKAANDQWKVQIDVSAVTGDINLTD